MRFSFQTARIRAFQHLLSKPEEHTIAAQIADFLRSNAVTLSDLGVGPAQNRETAVDSEQWTTLRRSLRTAVKSDGLVIFRAMASHLLGEGMTACAPVMTDVFRSPWRLQAIEAVPNFFLNARKIKGERLLGEEQHASNAFQLLALAGGIGQYSMENTRDCLQLLKNVGVQDFPSPVTDAICLHCAAYYHAPASFGAFIAEFPEYLENMNNLQQRPLHNAAISKHAGNVRLLLDAGVVPRPVSKAMDTPMRLSAMSNNDESVLMLIGTGAYTDDDVADAMSHFSYGDTLQRLQTFHAAVKAHRAVNEARQHTALLPRLL